MGKDYNLDLHGLKIFAGEKKSTISAGHLKLRNAQFGFELPKAETQLS